MSPQRGERLARGAFSWLLRLVRDRRDEIGCRLRDSEPVACNTERMRRRIVASAIGAWLASACEVGVVPLDAPSASRDARAATDAVEVVDAPAERRDARDPRDATTADDAPVSCAGRALADRPDDDALHQVHVLYLLPSDGTDRALDTDGTLALSSAALGLWMSSRTGGTAFRFDTCGGALDITFHRLAESDAEIASHGRNARDHLESRLAAAGFDLANKLYLAYYEGTSSFTCADAAYPPGLVGRAAVVYLDGNPDAPVPCRTNPFAPREDAPGFMELAVLHELFHLVGAAGSCAPSFTSYGHVDDGPGDLMYQGELPWAPTTIDIGNDDYYGHGLPDCVDVATSVFLDPLPASATLPPGW
jgi:hypothetical protein